LDTITVVKLLGGGNFFIALPMLLGIRRSFPDSTLVAVVTPSTAHFAQAIGIFDRIELIQFRSLTSLCVTGIKALRAIFRTDVLLDLEIHSKLATCFGLATCARNRVGFFTNDFFLRRHLYTHLVFFNPQASRPEMYSQLATILGGTSATHEECNQHLRETLSPLPPTHGTVAVGVGCSDLGKVRQLGAAQWSRVLHQGLQNTSARKLIFLGAKSDAEAAQKIIEELQGLTQNVVFENLCGERALEDSLRVLAECTYFWGIDSALLHFARLMKVPAESFWGPTDPATLLAPVVGYSEKIHYRRIICSPCIHVAEEAPCGGRNLCMEGLFSENLVSTQEALANTTFLPFRGKSDC
jgi:ADP-heptose:LPS heptosyltransferase